jgi:hypothetical protein
LKPLASSIFADVLAELFVLPQLPATVLDISPNSSKPNCNSRDEADNFPSNLAVSQVSRTLSSPKFFYITRLEAPSIYRMRTINIGNNPHHIPKYTISSLLDSGWSFKEHVGRAVIEFAALHLACSDNFKML